MKDVGLPPGMDQANRFLDFLSSNLIQEYDIYCTRRIGENPSCKVRRIFHPSGEIFKDYYFKGQNLYFVKDNTLFLIRPHGRSGTFSGPLFTHWYYNGQWQSKERMLDIVDEKLLNIDSYSLPTVYLNDSCERRVMYSCLYYSE